MSNDFEKAAARGKQTREAREQAESEQQHRADDESERKRRLERQRIVWWTCSLGGMFKAELGWLYLFYASAFVLTPITIFAVLASELRKRNQMIATLESQVLGSKRTPDDVVSLVSQIEATARKRLRGLRATLEHRRDRKTLWVATASTRRSSRSTELSRTSRQ